MKSLLSFVLIVAVLALGNVPTIAQSQLPRIGALGGGRWSGAGANPKAFLQGLEELGYVDGKTILIERRSYKGKRNLIPHLAAELVRLKVDVIFTSGPTALRPTMEATKTIPIVTPNLSSDPVKWGFVKTLTRPGGNVTGLSMGTKGLGSKRMELLKEVLPSVSRVVFINPHRQAPTYLGEYKHAARKLGMELEVMNVRSHGDLEQAFATITTMGSDALIIERNSLTRRHPGQIGDFALKNRLPTMNNHRLFVKFGGLMSYGVNYPANWRRAAVYVDKILKGANPATLPVESPQLEFVINLKTAQKLGVKIPPEILLEANEIIQ